MLEKSMQALQLLEKNHILGQSSFCIKTFHLMMVNSVPKILTLHEKGTKISKIIVWPISQRQV